MRLHQTALLRHRYRNYTSRYTSLRRYTTRYSGCRTIRTIWPPTNSIFTGGAICRGLCGATGVVRYPGNGEQCQHRQPGRFSAPGIRVGGNIDIDKFASIFDNLYTTHPLPSYCKYWLGAEKPPLRRFFHQLTMEGDIPSDFGRGPDACD